MNNKRKRKKIKKKKKRFEGAHSEKKVLNNVIVGIEELG
jgi:hypothetical protein